MPDVIDSFSRKNNLLLGGITMIVSGTGSRSLVLESNEEKLRILGLVVAKMKAFYDDTPGLVVYSGGAEGADACYAAAARQLGIPYHLILPNQTYLSYYWKQHSITGTDRSEMAEVMIRGAADIIYCCEGIYGEDPHQPGVKMHANFIRNHHLLKDAEWAFVYKPTSSGTSHALTELKRHEVSYSLIE